jgi:DNA polymerase
METLNKCVLCELCLNKPPVNGVGNTDAEIMVIINKPNYYTIKHNDIFESEVGNILTKLFKMINIDIKDNVYITHLVKGRAVSLKQKNIIACKPYLKKEIEMVKPKVIVTMGYIPTKTILKSKVPLFNHIGKAYFAKDKTLIIPMYDINFVMRDVRYHGLALNDFSNLYKAYSHFINPNIAVFEDKLHPAIKSLLQL